MSRPDIQHLVRRGWLRGGSNFSAVVGPVEQGLALLSPAGVVSMGTVLPQLGDVPRHGPPSPDLAPVVGAAPAHVVAAVPLEPPPGVVGVDPPLFPPVGKRFRGVDPEEVQLSYMALVAEPGVHEPVGRELGRAVCHVLAAEHPQFQHLLRGQLGPEVGMEVLTHRLGQVIDVIGLHQVVDAYADRFHGRLSKYCL